MAAHSPTPQRPQAPLDVPFRQLSIRSLGPRGSAPRGEVPPIERVRGEFVEMRGFSPTLDQAARLFDLPREECSQVLGRLTSEGFITKTADGRYRLMAGD